MFTGSRADGDGMGLRWGIDSFSYDIPYVREKFKEENIEALGLSPYMRGRAGC